MNGAQTIHVKLFLKEKHFVITKRVMVTQEELTMNMIMKVIV